MGLIGNTPDAYGQTWHLPIDPDRLTYAEMIDIAADVVTDSGGIQEEAPSLDKPVLVVRETTERPEAVEAGTARVVGTDPSRILGEALGLLDDAAAYRAMAGLANPFGDGHAGRRGAAAIARLLGVATAEDRAVPRLGQPVPAAAGAAR
jgi:UDP-N-acetylglucosamine 2-epimerase (non-hydrolysing)